MCTVCAVRSVTVTNNNKKDGNKCCCCCYRVRNQGHLTKRLVNVLFSDEKIKLLLKTNKHKSPRDRFLKSPDSIRFCGKSAEANPSGPRRFTEACFYLLATRVTYLCRHAMVRIAVLVVMMLLQREQMNFGLWQTRSSEAGQMGCCVHALLRRSLF